MPQVHEAVLLQGEVSELMGAIPILPIMLVKTPEKPFRTLKVPGHVLKNRELSALEKLVLMNIHALEGKDGCHAPDKYFSRTFNISEDKVTEIITRLETLGHIYLPTVEPGRVRVIRSNTWEDGECVEVKLRAPFRDNNDIYNIYNIYIYNNIYINNIYNNSNNIYNTAVSPDVKLTESGRDFERAWSIYRLCYYKNLHTYPSIKVAREVKDIWRILRGRYTYNQALSFFLLHFNWKGPDGKDRSVLNTLGASGFPLGFLLAREKEYKRFFVDQVGEQVWNNEHMLGSFIDKVQETMCSVI